MAPFAMYANRVDRIHRKKLMHAPPTKIAEGIYYGAAGFDGRLHDFVGEPVP